MSLLKKDFENLFFSVDLVNIKKKLEESLQKNGWSKTRKVVVSAMESVFENQWLSAQEVIFKTFEMESLVGADIKAEDLLFRIDKVDNVSVLQKKVQNIAISLIEDLLEAGGSTLHIDSEKITKTKFGKLLPLLLEKRQEEIKESCILRIGPTLYDLSQIVLTHYGFEMLQAQHLWTIVDQLSLENLLKKLKSTGYEISIKEWDPNEQKELRPSISDEMKTHVMELITTGLISKNKANLDFFANLFPKKFEIPTSDTLVHRSFAMALEQMPWNSTLYQLIKNTNLMQNEAIISACAWRNNPEAKSILQYKKEIPPPPRRVQAPSVLIAYGIVGEVSPHSTLDSIIKVLQNKPDFAWHRAIQGIVSRLLELLKPDTHNWSMFEAEKTFNHIVQCKGLATSKIVQDSLAVSIDSLLNYKSADTAIGSSSRIYWLILNPISSSHWIRNNTAVQESIIQWIEKDLGIAVTVFGMTDLRLIESYWTAIKKKILTLDQLDYLKLIVSSPRESGTEIHRQHINLVTDLLESSDSSYVIGRIAEQNDLMRVPEVVSAIAKALENCTDLPGVIHEFQQNHQLLEYKEIEQTLLRKSPAIASEIASSDEVWKLVSKLLDIDPLVKQHDIQDAIRKRGDYLRHSIEEEVATQEFSSFAKMYPKWELVGEILQLGVTWSDDLIVTELRNEKDFHSCLQDLAEMEEIFQKPPIRKQLLKSLREFNLEKVLINGMRRNKDGMPWFYTILKDPEFAECISQRATDFADIGSSLDYRQIVETEGFVDAFGLALTFSLPRLFLSQFEDIDVLTRSENFAEHVIGVVDDNNNSFGCVECGWLKNPLFETQYLHDVLLRDISDEYKQKYWLSFIAGNPSLWQSLDVQKSVYAIIENKKIEAFQILTMLYSTYMNKSEQLKRVIINRLLHDKSLLSELVEHIEYFFNRSDHRYHAIAITSVPEILEIPAIQAKMNKLATMIADRIKKGGLDNVKFLEVPYYASHPEIVNAIIETTRVSSMKRDSQENYKTLRRTFNLLLESPILKENEEISECMYKALNRIYKDLSEPPYAEVARETMYAFPYPISDRKIIKEIATVLTNQEILWPNRQLLMKMVGPNVLELLEETILQLFEETQDKWAMTNFVVHCDELLKSPKIVERIANALVQFEDVENPLEYSRKLSREGIMSLARPELLSVVQVRSFLEKFTAIALQRADNKSERISVCDFLYRIEGLVDLHEKQEIDIPIIEILLKVLTKGENSEIEIGPLLNLFDSPRRKSLLEIFLMESNSLLSILKHGQGERNFSDLDVVRSVVAKRLETFPLVWEIVREIAAVPEWARDERITSSLKKRLEESSTKRKVREVLEHFPESKLII